MKNPFKKGNFITDLTIGQTKMTARGCDTDICITVSSVNEEEAKLLIDFYEKLISIQLKQSKTK